MTLSEAEYWEAIEQKLDKWVVACAGTETPFRHGKNRWLYVYNPATGKHGYLNLDTDVVHDNYRSEEETPFVSRGWPDGFRPSYTIDK